MNVTRHPRAGSGGRSTTYTDIFGDSSLDAGTQVDNGKPMNVRALALKRPPMCAHSVSASPRGWQQIAKRYRQAL